MVSGLAILPAVLRSKRLRAMGVVLDILVISTLVLTEHRIESYLFLFYFFPVMSAARYFGREWTLLVAGFAAFSYGYASTDSFAFLAASEFWFRAIVLICAAATSANLARLKDRAEAKLVRAIAQIDYMILRDNDMNAVMKSILKTAEDITGSDYSAIVFNDRRDEPFGEKHEAKRLVQAHYDRFTESGRLHYLLPEREFLTALRSFLKPHKDPSQWAGRLIPIYNEEKQIGVLGVFSTRSFHYRRDDEDRLDAMAPLVAIAQKNATRYPQLASRERYFENLVYNSPDPIIVLDAEGVVQNFNRECEKIWGFTEDDVRGHHVSEYYESPKHAREIGLALKEAKGHIQNYLARIKDRRGAIIPIRLSATTFYGKEKRRIGSLGIFKDDRRLRAEQLAAFGHLAQKTIHDIKTQIAIIGNWLTGLEARPKEPSLQRPYAGIRKATVVALGKLQNILMTAKPKTPEKSVLSLRTFLNEVEAEIREWVSAAGVTFTATGPDTEIHLLGDSEELNQVLMNLLANSIDAIAAFQPPGAGRIDLTVTADERSLYLSWCDNGGGMTPDAMLNAFTPFYTTKSAGSGLGLYNTKAIVESHEGSISVEPGGDGGTCFLITLPRLYPNASAPAVIADELIEENTR
jgi:PAS domain S-box-containing protein